MTQLDLFDMQDEQAQAWEEQNRKERQKQVAESTGTSLALEDAAGGNRRKRRQLAIEDAPGGSAQNSPQLALTQGQDSISDMARSEVSTMQGQMEERSSSMALAVRQQLGGLASNPGTDAPQPIPRPLKMPAAWHQRTPQQMYDSGGPLYRQYIDEEIALKRHHQFLRDGGEVDPSPASRIYLPGHPPPGVRYGPPEQSLARRAMDTGGMVLGKGATYGSMALGKIWDAIRIHPLDPDPVRNREMWREIRARQAAARDEALYAAIDRENAANIQAILDEAASRPQRGWFDFMLGNADDEAEQPEEPDNTWGDWSSITNPKPRPLGPPPLPPSSSSGADWPDLPPPPPKRKRDTQEDKERKWKAEQSAAAKKWDRQVAREDRLINKGMSGRQRKV